MKPIRERLTYANVVATLALFVAVGGTSAFAASQLDKNSVGPVQLKKNAVRTAKIKNGAVTRAKIKIDSLGSVPSADRAARADVAADALTLGGQSAAEIAAAAKLRCPAGTELTVGVCIEATTRPATTIASSIRACAASDRRLPSPAELVAYLKTRFSSVPPSEWVETYYQGKESPEGGTATASTSNGGAFGFEKSGNNPYRCVIPPSN